MQIFNNSLTRSIANHLPTLSTPSQIAKNLTKLAVPIITIASLAYMPQADAGLISGLVTLGGCVGAGILFPANLFWAAAPCYELTMIATANPLLP